MTADRLLQHFAVRLHIITLVADRPGARNVKVPVLIDRYLAVLAQFQAMPRQQFADPVIKSFFAREISEGQVFGKRRKMEFRAHSAVSQNHFDFRAKQERFRRQPVVQRFDAQSVARREQRTLLAVPDGKCKHPAQVMHTVAPVLFVQMNNRFRIAVGAVTVAAGFQIFSQGRVVVNLSVENDPGGPSLVADRLMPPGNINNAEAAHAQRDRAIGIKTVVVGAAMRHGGTHLSYRARISSRVASELHYPGNSAHGVASTLFSCSRASSRVQEFSAAAPQQRKTLVTAPRTRSRPSPWSIPVFRLPVAMRALRARLIPTWMPSKSPAL